MMNLTNLGLTLHPLVSDIFAIFLCVLMSPLILLFFWGMMFLHQRESSPKVFKSLYYFGARIPYFPSKFQNRFYSNSVTLRSHCL